MKHLFSYGIWLAAIASYMLIFFKPENSYIPYANNIIFIYEVFAWIIFFLFLIFNIFFLFGKVNVSKKTLDDLSDGKALKALKEFNKRKFLTLITQGVHICFIVFIGVFVGDMSMTLILSLNLLQTLFLKNSVKNFLEEVSHGNGGV